MCPPFALCVKLQHFFLQTAFKVLRFEAAIIKIVALIMDEMAVCYRKGSLLVSSALQKPRGVVVFVLQHLPAEQSPDLYPHYSR